MFWCIFQLYPNRKLWSWKGFEGCFQGIWQGSFEGWLSLSFSFKGWLWLSVAYETSPLHISQHGPFVQEHFSERPPQWSSSFDFFERVRTSCFCRNVRWRLRWRMNAILGEQQTFFWFLRGKNGGGNFEDFWRWGFTIFKFNLKDNMVTSTKSSGGFISSKLKEISICCLLWE